MWAEFAYEGLSFDPFPIDDEQVLEALTDEDARIFPPDDLESWPEFWSGIRQLVSPVRRNGNRIRQVLMPVGKLVDEYTEKERHKYWDWQRWTMHTLSWGAFRMEEMTEVSTAWLLDLASMKSRVGKKLLEGGWMVEGAHLRKRSE